MDALETCGAGAAATTLTAAFHLFAASQCLLDEHWPKSTPVENGSHFDFIIVGGGTAGSTLAARLAQVYKFHVLLVEAGDNPPVESIIPGFRDVLKGSQYDWNFTTVNDGLSSQGLLGGRQVQPRGKMLGGSGSLNDMVYSRGHPEDYYEWADIAGDTWNWTNVLHYFKKTEHMTDENIIKNKELMEFHGLYGEIEVSGKKQYDYVADKLLEAFNELGFNIVDDMTYPYKIGAGRFSHTVENGKRASSLTALLNNVHTDNLHVLSNAYVTKILIEDKTALGVRAIVEGKEVEFYADQEVILAAGTFNTPKLMMLSGIGPRDHLYEVGVDVIQNLPVGDNLHDHTMVMNYLVIRNGTCTNDDAFRYLEMIKYLYNFTGIFSYSDSVGAYLPAIDGDLNIPHFAIYPTCVPQAGMSMGSCLSVLGYDEAICQKIVSINQNHELTPVPVVLLKPKSRGKVRLKSNNPEEDPLIYSGTFSNPADYKGYTEAIQLALSLVNTTYFKNQGASVLDFIWEKCSELVNLEEQLLCMMLDYAMPAWHAVGTAAMGSVVDSELKVIGVEGLRVVDASVIPVVIRGNTNAAVVMIAEMAAEFIKKTYGSL